MTISLPGERTDRSAEKLEPGFDLVAERDALRAELKGVHEAWALDRAEIRRLRASEASMERALTARVGGRDQIVKAIRAITVDVPDDQPNGPAEQALLDLEHALDPRVPHETYGARLDAARGAAARLSEALADDTRDLRVAAEAYFGGDFAKPEASGQ